MLLARESNVAIAEKLCGASYQNQTIASACLVAMTLAGGATSASSTGVPWAAIERELASKIRKTCNPLKPSEIG
jgi:hypothetical protein